MKLRIANILVTNPDLNWLYILNIAVNINSVLEFTAIILNPDTTYL